jgi:hypothetical protein
VADIAHAARQRRARERGRECRASQAGLMVPVEVTAFGLLAVCVILLAVVLAVQVLARPALLPGRVLMLLALGGVVIAGVYVWATTRVP